MKIVKFEGAVTTITISRTPNSSPTHSHDLDHMDDVKRNSGLMNVIWKEAEKAYLPASIFAKFREHYQRLADLGGKFMRASDVRNVCAKWRAMHPTVPLRTHAGYQHAHGLGVMKLGEQRAISAVGHGMMGMSTMPMGPMQPPLPGPRTLAPGALPFPNFPLDFLESYMPRDTGYRPYPHVTLTYASSMDAKVSLMPGIQTALSCHESKLMTHYLRSRHDAVLIGLRTALADDPGLNCRLDGAGGYGGLGRMWQPRPVIVDPTGKWPVNPESRMMKIAKEGRGKAPWVVVSPGAVVSPDKLTLLKSYGGDFLRIVDYNAFWRLRWEAILAALAAEGVRSVMIEGGAAVISELLNPEYTDFIDSLIVTVAPTFLGKKGLGVAPDSKYDENGKPKTAMSPREVRWQPLGQDVIMCGKMRNPPPPQPRPPVQPTVSEAPAPAILEGIEAVARSADR
jgi:2,5-diamino-6-(ribosylamino)-4(3H)-pyrimidinone 5'-phosphate reductase